MSDNECDVEPCKNIANSKVRLKSCVTGLKVTWDVCGNHLAEVAAVLMETGDTNE